MDAKSEKEKDGIVSPFAEPEDPKEKKKCRKKYFNPLFWYNYYGEVTGDIDLIEYDASNLQDKYLERKDKNVQMI